MNKREIEEWLTKYKITKYHINDDLTVDVHGRVYLDDHNIPQLPFQFGKIWGYFSCTNTNLISLKNFPLYVDGNFFICNNNLTSLQYCPRYIGCNIHVYDNKITSIKELFEVHIGGAIFVDRDLEKTSEYKLLMKLRDL
jgi:hypothetical protein